ncbi:DUF1456 family protein [bacterium]|nr:MAG: DUF1456 family protein [bacterium]
MTNNDIFRSIRYILKVNDQKMADICALGEHEVKLADVAAFVKREEEEGYIDMPHSIMGHFLNGLVIFKRGRDDSRPIPRVEIPVTNNVVLKKLRVAFELRDTDMEDIFKKSGFTITKSELSAFFRAPDHKNYRPCKDQVMRNFLKGLAERTHSK